jgi:tetratricopeptide (TPR) repeat protein
MIEHRLHMSDFFVSYTQKDKDWAMWIARVLEDAGNTTTTQEWDFRPGSNFVVEMQRATVESKRTLVVLSADYLRSGFAMSEWSAAFAQDPTGEKGLLLPVRVGAVEPPGILGTIVYIDLIGLDEAPARERLLAGLSRGSVRPVPPPPFPVKASPPFPGVEATEAQLASLPLDEIPLPGPLPAGSRMPLAANPLFVGREDDLRTLARQLRAGETTAVGQMDIAAATGLGGIGKSQLASEFVHRYGRFFPGGVFWMSFADPAAVPAEIAACGRSLNLHLSFDTLTLEQQVRLVEDAWQSPIPRLLVFDNCEDEDLLDRRRPRFGGSRVLVTSRRSQWDAALGVKTISLNTLPRSASIELLRRFRSDVPESDPALDGIADELGDLPLALHLAGSFLRVYAQSIYGQPSTYLASLRQGNLLEHPSLKSGQHSRITPTGHEAHVARTFALSFDRLDSKDSTDGLAIALLARAACLAPGDPIPRPLLLATVDTAAEDFMAGLRAENALGRLLSLGLLESGNSGTLVMHRLIAVYARSVATGEEARGAIERSVLSEAKRLNETSNPALLLALQPHLRKITDEASLREDSVAARLCDELGEHLWRAGDYRGARPYLERAVVIHQKVCGLEHEATAGSLNALGVLHRSSGEYLKALSCYEKALKIREAVLGLENPEAAQSLNDIGVVLHDLGDPAGARAYHERALAIREKVLGLEHPDTVISLNNLGVLLQSEGDDPARVRAYYERALAIREKILGPEHPDTALSLNNLGFLLQSQGDLAGARAYYERALAIREKILGPEHPDTALSLNNLGALLNDQGGFAGARPYYERALAIREKVLGPEHPDTAQSLMNLGGLWINQRNLPRARRLLERACVIFEARLGRNHPNTKGARIMLSSLPGNRQLGKRLPKKKS